VFSVRTKSLLRGVVGVVTGYLFAIQLILAGAVATQMAAPSELQAICHGVDAAVSGVPQKTPAQSADHHVGCPICAFSSGIPPLPDTSPILPNRRSLENPTTTISWFTKSSRRQHEPRSSQGPPPVV
jgi:hypothetical protein